MSVVNQGNLKVLLPRAGTDEFWRTVCESIDPADARKWKYLAMLALREAAGWPLEQIAFVFNHPTGHVSRCLRSITQELRTKFEPPDDYFGLDDYE
jgi:hypothetical protein